MRLAIVLMLLLAGCKEKPMPPVSDTGSDMISPNPENLVLVADPVSLKGTKISFGLAYASKPPRPYAEITWTEGRRDYKETYDDEQAIRVLRKWLDANYPEKP